MKKKKTNKLKEDHYASRAESAIKKRRKTGIRVLYERVWEEGRSQEELRLWSMDGVRKQKGK